MKNKIRMTVISTYKEMEGFFKNIEWENIELKVKTINEIQEIKKFIEDSENDTDIFLSRGATVRRIKENSNIPVVNVLITNFDLIKAIVKAKQYKEDEIGFLSYYEDKYEIEEIEKIFNIKIKNIKYENTIEVEEKIKKLVDGGVRVIIGGGMTPVNAKKFGVKSILLKSSNESIRNAISNAITVARVRNTEREKSARLNAILNSIHEGIIVTDEENKVKIYNLSAEKILNKKRETVINKDIVEVVENTKMHKINLSNKSEIGVLQEINGEIIATSRVPIFIENKKIGVVSTFEKASSVEKIEKKIRENLHEKGLRAKYTFKDIEVRNKKMEDIKILAKLYAKTDETILIHGESGTGKELFAQGIHNESNRKEQPFVAINCAAIPENLLESELFGYEGGAFTGAKKDGKIGVFELAHKGTIFLDEIGEISKHLQSSLLRVIQEKEVRRVGGDKVIPIDIRIICATNRNLEEEVEKGNFREDLYYRLNVLYINLLPLRERREDIELIARKLLGVYEDKEIMEETVIDILRTIPKEYRWRGNIRELDSVVKRAYLMAKAPSLCAKKESNFLIKKEEGKNRLSVDIDLSIGLKEMVAYLEQNIIKYFLEKGCSIEEILKKLDISRATYMRKK